MPRNERSCHSSINFDDLNSIEFCDGCPACDLIAQESILHLEADLERLSLSLWAQGWTPPRLLEEVRRATGLTGATDLLAHLLIADDSLRSDQARPPAWVSETDQLRARVGIADVEVGWLPRWIAANADGQQASQCVTSLVAALFGLVGSSAVA